MISLNRRGFLQAAGAVGLAPLLPGLPARATVTSGGISTSKALWASLYANAGSTSEFVGFAKNMGLSNSAIQGVSARSVGVRVALNASGETVKRIASNPGRPAATLQDHKLNLRNKLQQTIERTLSADEIDEQVSLETEVDEVDSGEAQENTTSDTS